MSGTHIYPSFWENQSLRILHVDTSLKSNINHPNMIIIYPHKCPSTTASVLNSVICKGKCTVPETATTMINPLTAALKPIAALLICLLPFV